MASSSQHSAEIQELARFAVEQHNLKENGAFELVRVAKAEEQVVSGTLHHLTLEVMEAGKKMVYEAKVWVKPWIDFRELQEFKCVSDFVPKKVVYQYGWTPLSVDDPIVKEEADAALKAYQQKSNSLVPYQLHQILSAEFEMLDESARYKILVKLKRGEKEEKMKLSIYKDPLEFRV